MAELLKYQTLAVGFIGFSGVMLTLVLNAWLARVQRRGERRRERAAIRAALLAELKINLDGLKQNLENSKENTDSGSVFAPTDTMDDAFRAFIHSLGLLSPEEAHKVMLAYLSIRTFKSKLFLIGVPTSTGDHHVDVPAKNLPLLDGMQRGLISPICDAIQVMERAQGM